MHLLKVSSEVVRRWVSEVQEAVHSPSEAVQFHALSLLYSIKSHDRLAVSKMVSQMTRVSMGSPLATCLLIRYISQILREPGAEAASNAQAAQHFLEGPSVDLLKQATLGYVLTLGPIWNNLNDDKTFIANMWKFQVLAHCAMILITAKAAGYY